MWKIGRLTSQSCAVCVRCISLYAIRGWWGLLEDVHSYLKEKGALAGSIYESFNYISKSEFQLEGKVGKKKKRKENMYSMYKEHGDKSMARDNGKQGSCTSWHHLHDSVFRYPFQLSFALHTTCKMFTQWSNRGLCYSSLEMQGKDHLQLLRYKAVTFFWQIINCVIKQHSTKGRQRQIATFVSVLMWTV